jgi:hypothetical protein
MSWPWETPVVRRTVIPRAVAERANSSHSLLFPTPASPTTPTTWAEPSVASAKASSNTANSRSRPTSGEVPSV